MEISKTRLQAIYGLMTLAGRELRDPNLSETRRKNLGRMIGLQCKFIEKRLLKNE